MRIAAIDIGTNTCLLLLAEIDGEGSIEIIRQEQRLPRLGKAVDANGSIQLAAFGRISTILTEYKAIAEKNGVTHICACATSATSLACSTR